MMENRFFEILKRDHRKVKGILGSLEKTKESAPRKREELLQKLKVELVPHMKAEEITFYRSLLSKKEARKGALEGAEEHHVSDIIFKELEETSKGEDRWGAKMNVFKELVEHHIREEESKIFKSAKKTLAHDEIQNILTMFEQEKRRIRKTLK